MQERSEESACAGATRGDSTPNGRCDPLLQPAHEAGLVGASATGYTGAMNPRLKRVAPPAVDIKHGKLPA